MVALSGIHNKAVGRVDIGVFKAMTFSSLIDLLSRLDAVVRQAINFFYSNYKKKIYFWIQIIKKYVANEK